MMTDKNDMQLLVKAFGCCSDQEWMCTYFDLMKYVLTVTGLENDDPRLVMSLPFSKKWYLPITINHRYVIALQKQMQQLFVGLIFNSSATPEIDHHHDSKLCGQYKKLRNEHSEPPYFLRFNSTLQLFSLLKTSKQIRQCLDDTLLAETQRASASPYKKYHQPIFYNIVIDDHFRTQVFDMVYGKHESSLDLLPEQIDEPQKFYEGTLKMITVNAYERNSQSRDICIAHYGLNCVVCGINFQEKYGYIGKGFIHVHHLKPLSEIGTAYALNPVQDLRPVCPNCHAMLHKKKPPYSIEELKQLIKTHKVDLS